jgi:hypothetical protein
MEIHAGQAPNWNEIQFLSFKEFLQMAPTILQLEITRLGKIIQELPPRVPFRNDLVRARFETAQFVECLKSTEKSSIESVCAIHLQNAILSLSVQPEDLEPGTRETWNYVLDRLNYVHHRVRLIY